MCFVLFMLHLFWENVLKSLSSKGPAMRKLLFPPLFRLIGAVAVLAYTFGCSSNGGADDYSIKATGVELSSTNLEISRGETAFLQATVKPENATNKKVVWNSSNSAIASVTDGIVTASSAGIAVISAHPEDGVGTAYCTVSVVVPVSTIILGTRELGLDVDGIMSMAIVSATVGPDEAGDKRVVWSSDNPSVATVSSQGPTTSLSTLVTAVAPGVTTIRATSPVNGTVGDYCIVTVVTNEFIGVEDMFVTPSKLQVLVGDTGLLTATVLPANATDKYVQWVSDNRSVATVDANGRVTGVSEGIAHISATTEDGGFRDEAEVEVARQFHVTGVTINKLSLSMVVGYSEALTATVQPANATDKGVWWESDNNTVARVSSVGMVEAVGPGATKIRVTSDDRSRTAECDVTVHSMYIAGHEPSGLGTAAKLWVNGQARLTGSTGSSADACSVFVWRGQDFVAGHQVNSFGNSVATVWRNGEPDLGLTPGAVNGSANSVFVSGLNDVLVAGYEENANKIAVATLWRNGQFFAYLTNGGGKAEAKSVFASGANIYAAGYDTNIIGITVPFVSINGNTQFLTNGSRSGGASSVFFWGGNTYVAGWENDQDGRPVAMLWVNGAARALGAGNGMANAVHVSAAGDVYVAGYEINSRGVAVATVWRGDSAMSLTNGGSEAVANSVYILETDVYVVGYETNAAGKPEPKVWRNGFARTIAQEGKANSIVIAPPVI
jgi:uncharacterized protein YjdB